MNSSLSEKAVRLALSKEWDKAIEVNKKILENNPLNKKALLRLGKALIQIKDYPEAKVVFQKVLELDPINKIAKRNLKALEEKVSTNAIA